ncbi:MAG: ABC transporter ATP-binding protein [Oleiphilaceae bacterium]|nr:ABC transporter ATP-binding protein [Oleiphilaceae bacterium]
MRHTSPLLNVENLRFRWPNAERDCLHIPCFTMQAGERVFLRGPSGAGKTTLLSLLTGMLEPSQGSITLLEREIRGLTRAQRDRFRATHIGYIFQQFNLIPYLSVFENVALGCRFSAERMARVQREHGDLKEACNTLTQALQLPATLMHQKAQSLSVGQQQRVAAARALIGAPPLIIADEPTSALDADTRARFIELVMGVCQQHHSALLFVSHDASLQSHFDRSVDLLDINQQANRSEAE